MIATLAFLVLAGAADAQFDARVQAIHNAPDPDLAVVDLYVADQLVLDDVEFRTASPYLDIPGIIPLTGGLAPGNSTGPDDVFFEFTFTLTPFQTYQFILVGVRDPGQFLPNPDGRDISLDVLVNEDAREVGSDSSMLDVNVIHGITDAPASDVEWGTVLADDIQFGEATGYTTFWPDESLIVVNPSPGILGFAPPIVDDGEVITLLLSGFHEPDANQNGPLYGVLAVRSDGEATLLDYFPIVSTEDPSEPRSFTLRGNYPNPVNLSTTIAFDLAISAIVSIEVFDVFGRRMTKSENAYFPPGAGQEFWLDASSLPSGAYVYRFLVEMSGGMLMQTGRMTVLR